MAGPGAGFAPRRPARRPSTAPPGQSQERHLPVHDRRRLTRRYLRFKPRLIADGGRSITVDNWQGRRGQFRRFLKAPGWTFRRGGQSGTEVSDLFPFVRGVVDDLCVIRSMESNHTNHYEGTLGIHTGSWTFARPSIGRLGQLRPGHRESQPALVHGDRSFAPMPEHKPGAPIFCPVAIRAPTSSLARRRSRT